MRYLIIFGLISFVIISCDGGDKKQKQKEISNTNQVIQIKPQVFQDSIINKLTAIDLSYKPSIVDGHTWIPFQLLKSIYSKGMNNVKRNKENYPFESIYIENWKNKKIYAESAKLDYRKIRVNPLNDSTYYITNWNNHHYKNKDSIFLVRRNNEVSIISKKDSISYISGIGVYPFKNYSLTSIIHRISFYNKKFNMLDSKKNLIDSNISFNLDDNTVKNSKNIKNYLFTAYYLNNNYLIKLDSTDYFFKWKKNTAFLESKTGNKLILKQIEN